MILTCHLLTGAAIASKIRPVPLALILAFLSHYLLDFIPHRDYSAENIFKRRWRKAKLDFLKIFLDFSLGILLVWLLSGKSLIISAAVFLAVLPDGLTFLAWVFPKNKLLSKHCLFHQETIHFIKNKKVSLFWRIFSQVLVFSGAIYLLL